MTVDYSKYTLIETERRGRVLTLTLNNPPMNALNQVDAGCPMSSMRLAYARVLRSILVGQDCGLTTTQPPNQHYRHVRYRRTSFVEYVKGEQCRLRALH